jgi:hypothetical protein
MNVELENIWKEGYSLIYHVGISQLTPKEENP